MVVDKGTDRVVQMERYLFPKVIGSEIVPVGTRIKFASNNLSTAKTVGYACADGTVSGLTFKDICNAYGTDSRQTANRLHAHVHGVTLGLSAYMVRHLKTHADMRRAMSACGISRPPMYMCKLWNAYIQKYMDPLQGFNPRRHFTKMPDDATYDPYFPDRYVYDNDHIVPVCEMGQDCISNLQALNISSHRCKTNLDMMKYRNRRFHRRLSIRKNVRYWFRSSRSKDYTKYM